MNTTMADGANERLDAQIAEALFGQPGMSKMDVANRVRELRGDGPALLVPREPGQDERARFEAWAHAQSYRGGNIMADRDSVHPDVYADPVAQLTWKSWQAALSAQPSPGGQGWPFVESPADFAERMVQALRKFDMLGAVRHVLIENPPALAARQPVRIYGCCAQPEGELHTAECPNMRHLAARQPVGHELVASCKTCGGSGYVDDGEIDCYPDGTPYMCGPVKCVRDCPTCSSPPAQAVDLDKLRLLGQRIEQVGRNAAPTAQGSGNVYFRNVIDWGRELLALIDGKAVGNG